MKICNCSEPPNWVKVIFVQNREIYIFVLRCVSCNLWIIKPQILTEIILLWIVDYSTNFHLYPLITMRNYFICSKHPLAVCRKLFYRYYNPSSLNSGCLSFYTLFAIYLI